MFACSVSAAAEAQAEVHSVQHIPYSAERARCVVWTSGCEVTNAVDLCTTPWIASHAHGHRRHCASASDGAAALARRLNV